MARSPITSFWHDVLDRPRQTSISIAQPKLDSPAASSPHPPILSLPQELLAEVVSYLLPPRSSGLLELRTTCKELHIRTDEFFAPAYFSYRTFKLADAASLKTLRSISGHPTFSKSMTCIGFSLAAIASDEFDGDDSDESDEVLEYAGFPQFMREINVFSRRRPYACQPLISPDQERFKFLRDGQCSQYLHTIFKNFIAIGSIPLIATKDAEAAAVTYTTRSDLLPSANGFNQEELQVLYSAICRAEYPVVDLELGCHDTGISLQNASYFRSSPAFAHLEILELTFLPLRYPSIDPDPGRNVDPGCYYTRQCIRDGIRHLISFLRSAANLQELTLALSYSTISSSDSHAMMFAAIVQEVSSASRERALQKLHTFQLEGICYYAYPRDLLTFVRATRSTLNVLRLDGALKDWGLPTGRSLAKRVLKAYGSEDLQLQGNVWTVDCDSDDERNDYDW